MVYKIVVLHTHLTIYLALDKNKLSHWRTMISFTFECFWLLVDFCYCSLQLLLCSLCCYIYIHILILLLMRYKALMVYMLKVRTMQYLTIIESASGMIQKKCQSISKSFQLQFSKLLPLERVLNLCALGTTTLPLIETLT